MSENDINAIKNEENLQNEEVIPANIEAEIPRELSVDAPVEEKDSTNIFDDFVKNQESQEAKDLQREENKDLYYYLSLTGSLFKTLSIIGLIFLGVLFGYVSVQKNEKITDASWLDPFCSFILGDVSNPEGTTYCSSVAYAKTAYETKITEVKTEYGKKILSNLSTLYERENFLGGKDIAFIREESENKLKITDVLNRFDEMKREFSSLDKSKIQCGSMTIDSINRTLEITCDAYSQGYEEKGITGFSGDINEPENAKLSGTSLSVANSFLNFIEKKSTNFTLVDRQKVFSIENVIFAGYTKKTKFNIKLKINF